MSRNRGARSPPGGNTPRAFARGRGKGPSGAGRPAAPSGAGSNPIPAGWAGHGTMPPGIFANPLRAKSNCNGEPVATILGVVAARKD